jgi:hypothetical protein
MTLVVTKTDERKTWKAALAMTHAFLFFLSLFSLPIPWYYIFEKKLELHQQPPPKNKDSSEAIRLLYIK